MVGHHSVAVYVWHTWHMLGSGSLRFTPFRGKSSYCPSGTDNSVLERYITATDGLLCNLSPESARSNFSRLEWQALHELRANESLVIKKSDKGGNVVVLDASTYREEGLRQLSGPQYRIILDPNFSRDTHNEIADWAERNLYWGNIDRCTFDYLSRKDGSLYRTSRLYMLPKTHKDPPYTGRPIISGTNCPSERASAFLQLFLAAVVVKQFTYLRDTGHFLQTVVGRVVTGRTYLVALDITSMYTCVMDAVFSSGIATVKGIRLLPAMQFRIVLRLCLLRINFVFGSNQYIQVRGVPMGSKFSPEVADIVGFALERRIFAAYDAAIEWSRYRDDCFLIFNGLRADLERFLTGCNNAHETLKFKYEISDTAIPFLDTTIFVTDEGVLGSRVYRKAAYAFQYLHRQSCHPPAVCRSFIKGELLRLARNSSSLTDFEDSSTLYRSKLVDRGYSLTEVGEVSSAVDYHQVRLGDRAVRDNSTKFVFIVPYYP
jgi:hypothetical protein